MLRFLLIACTFLWAGNAMAQNLAGLARATSAKLEMASNGGVHLELSVTQSVPYSIQTFRNPSRISIQFHTVSFPEGLLDKLSPVRFVQEVAVTNTSANTSEVSLFLTIPAQVRTVEFSGNNTFHIVLTPTSDENFRNVSQVSDLERDNIFDTTVVARNKGDRPWVIALDPGHGGIDPGANGGRQSEADLMLLFGFELREALRARGYEVVMTRDSDEFVGLEQRMTIARDSHADVFLSLHADAVLEGVAEGVTIYTLSDRAHAEANTKLSERHDRHDLLAGIDLSGQGDEVAQVLLDLLRHETRPRSNALAYTLIEGMKVLGVRTNSKPVRQQDFAVLRAADIPSVLIELGFLSSPRDLAQLESASGRLNLINGLIAGLDVWAQNDAAQATLLRQ